MNSTDTLAHTSSRPAHAPILSAPPIRAGSERLLFVLSAFANTGAELTLADLMSKTHLPKSTLYRQLALLKNWGFVAHRDGEYTPGPMCVPLAWGFDNFSYLVQESQETLDELRDQTEESVGLLAAVGTRAVCLTMAQSTHLLRCSLTKGRSVLLCAGASAKALLAFMDPTRRKQVLQELRRDGLLSHQGHLGLESDLVAIRRQGHAVSSGEVDVGIWGISAPVFQNYLPYTDVVISLMAPAARAAGRESSLRETIQQGAERITDKLRQVATWSHDGRPGQE